MENEDLIIFFFALKFKNLIGDVKTAEKVI